VTSHQPTRAPRPRPRTADCRRADREHEAAHAAGPAPRASRASDARAPRVDDFGIRDVPRSIGRLASPLRVRGAGCQAFAPRPPSASGGRGRLPQNPGVLYSSTPVSSSSAPVLGAAEFVDRDGNPVTRCTIRALLLATCSSAARRAASRSPSTRASRLVSKRDLPATRPTASRAPEELKRQFACAASWCARSGSRSSAARASRPTTSSALWPRAPGTRALP